MGNWRNWCPMFIGQLSKRSCRETYRVVLSPPDGATNWFLELYLIMWFQSHLSQQKHPHWQGPEETDPIVSDLPFLPHLGLITSSILPKTPPCTISETISSSPIFVVNICKLNFTRRTRELKSGRSLALLIRPALSLIQSCLCSSLSMSAEPKICATSLYIFMRWTINGSIKL